MPGGLLQRQFPRREPCADPTKRKPPTSPEIMQRAAGKTSGRHRRACRRNFWSCFYLLMTKSKGANIRTIDDVNMAPGKSYGTGEIVWHLHLSATAIEINDKSDNCQSPFRLQPRTSIALLKAQLRKLVSPSSKGDGMAEHDECNSSSSSGGVLLTNRQLWNTYLQLFSEV